MKSPRSWVRLLAVLASAVAVGGGLRAGPQPFAGAAASPPTHPKAPSTAQVKSLLGKLPIYFVQNRGQADSRVRYYVPGHASSVFFTSTGATYSLSGTVSDKPASWAVQQQFVGANAAAVPVASKPTDAIFSYFRGAHSTWSTGNPAFGRLLYRNVWPGVDVEYAGSAGRLEYTFVVHPGASPSSIQLAYRGAQSVGLDAQGRLSVGTPVGGFQEQAPVAYQVFGGKRVSVAAGFQHLAGASNDYRYGFRLGAYDRRATLVIDPVVLDYSGFIGGYAQDTALAVAVDDAGNAYVSGQTNSSQDTFPVRIGPGKTWMGQSDVFVCKVTPAAQLQYCGYIGGTSSDRGRAITVDPVTGIVFAAGWVRSTEQQGFPVIQGPDLTYNGGSSDAYVAKVSAKGDRLLYCGYLGGKDHDEAKNIAIDSQDNAYVTGGSKSQDWAMPDPNVFQPQSGDPAGKPQGDTFVAKVDNNGHLVAETYFGGKQEEHARGISVDSTGVFLGGTTHSSQSDNFPLKVGPDLTYNGAGDSFVAKLSLDLHTLNYSGYVGGNQYEDTRDQTVDASGNNYICGHTASDQSTFPVLVGPDLTFNGISDAFVTEVSADGTHLVFSGFLGGASKDSCYGVSVGADGNVYVAGHVNSDENTFPVLNPGDLGSRYIGQGDAFIAGIKGDGSALLWCGYIGGHGPDDVWAEAQAPDGKIVVVGKTASPTFTPPMTNGPDLTYNGAADAWIAEVTP